MNLPDRWKKGRTPSCFVAFEGYGLRLTAILSVGVPVRHLGHNIG